MPQQKSVFDRMPAAEKRALLNIGLNIKQGKPEQGYGQPSIASVDTDSPNTLMIHDPSRFNQDPAQVVAHEGMHLWQNNLPPAIQAQIPPDNPKDPYSFTAKGLNDLRARGGTILDLPREIQGRLAQYAVADPNNKPLQQAIAPYLNDMNKIPLSSIMPTDPNQQGINTTPRPPMPPPETYYTDDMVGPGSAPVTLDFSKAQPVQPVTLDFSKAQPVNGAPAALDLSNSKDEGLYQMRSTDGQRTGVPYSKVLQAAQAGYQWANDSELQRYSKDNAADPKRATSYAPTQAESTPEGHQQAVNAREDASGPLGQVGIGVAKGAGTILQPVGDVIDAVSNNPNPTDNTARGALQTAGKAATISGAVIPAAIAAPIATGFGLAGGAAGAYAGGKLGAAMGLGPHGEALVADAGGLAGGAGAAKGGAEAADALGGPARQLASRILPSLVDGPPESLMTRAIKPGKNNVNWNADLQKAVPLMKSAEQQLGHPVAGVDDALEAANLAKKGIWQQYQARLGPSGQMGATIDGNSIADAMVNSIDRRTAIQNPGLVAKVQKVADTYRRPLPLNEAEDFLQSANKDLNSYYAKNKVGQQVALNDPEMSSTVAEAQALRSSLYSKLDQIAGPGASQLKQAYGSLTNVEKELYGRQLVAARQNPESLSEQLSTVRGAAKIAKGIVTVSPGDVLEGAQNIAVSRALKARNSSDAMIQRAFAKAQPATPFPVPSSPRFAGLLQRGPIQTPAPADASGSIAYQPPPFSNTTRQQRLGLMLPAQTGGPIELPYTPEMTGGEQLAALMHYLRQRPQAALPAQASPIPLPPPR